MTFKEGVQAVCRKLDIDYDNLAAGNNGLFTLDDIKEVVNIAAKRVWDYKPWDFTEGDKKITAISADYYDYPEYFQTGSIDLLLVAGTEYRKLSYKDYMKLLAEDANADDEVWCERKRYIFINKNAYSVGDEIDAFGKLRFSKLTADADLLPFSTDSDDIEDSGNNAVVLLAYAEVLGSEKMKNPSQALVEEKNAFEILDILWKPQADLQSVQQTERVFWNTPDYFKGGINNTFTQGNF